MNDESRKKIKQNRIEDLAFSKQIDNYFNGTLDKKHPAFVMKTPIVLGLVGANKDLDIIMNYEAFDKVTKSWEEYYHGHGITKNILEHIPEQLRNPVMIFENKAKKSLVIITDLKDYLNRGIMISIGLEQNVQRHKVNRITSMYGRNNFVNYLDNQIKYGNLLAANIKKLTRCYNQ